MSTQFQLTLQQANTMAAACLDKGRSLGLRPLTVVVLDPGGRLIALQRGDNCSNLTPRIAIAKASGVIALGISSRKIGAMAANMPNFLPSVAPLSSDGIIGAAGGLLVTDKNGVVLGAIAVGGDMPDNDEICALAGIEAAGLTAGE